MKCEEAKTTKCEVIESRGVKDVWAKTGAGAAVLLAANPAWANAQSEHEWSGADDVMG